MTPTVQLSSLTFDEFLEYDDETENLKDMKLTTEQIIRLGKVDS